MTKPLPVLPHMQGERGRVGMYAKLLKTYWKQMHEPNAHKNICHCVFRSRSCVQGADTRENIDNVTTGEKKTASRFVPLKPTIRFKTPSEINLPTTYQSKSLWFHHRPQRNKGLRH